MTIYVAPGGTYEAASYGAAPGLVGTIGVRVLHPATGTEYAARTTAGITEQPAASGVYFKTLTAPVANGAYALIWDDGSDEFAEEDLIVTVSVPLPSGATLSGPPCVAWCTPAEVIAINADVASPPTPDEMLPYVAMASEVLYEQSGRQWSGGCEALVRPCRSECGCWGADRYGALNSPWYWGYGPLGWSWFGASGGSCGCGCDDRLKLSGFPVTEIHEVVIDGVVVPDSEWQLQDSRWLQRFADSSTDPPTDRFWPTCQNMNLELGQPGTWSVSYTFGTAPPEAGHQAAIELAWQFWLALHNPGECVLPTGVTRVVRQGVTIERMLPMFGAGQRTGLVLTDAFLGTYNPNGLRRRPAVWSPDVHYPRRIS